MSEGTQAALLALLTWLKGQGYHFITPTPDTHSRVIARAGMERARDLRGAFGWSLPFGPELLPADLLAQLQAAGLVKEEAGGLKSTVRASCLHDQLFLHSAYPTTDEDSVFFGPDTYRFLAFMRAELAQLPPARHLVDLGTGSGAGGIVAALIDHAESVTLIDVNPRALMFAGVNAKAAGVEATLVRGSSLDTVSPPIDLVIANPPFIMDEHDRTYRDGGGMNGAQVSFDWTLDAARRLEPGGRMLLYTGVAIVDGRDALHEALKQTLPEHGCTLRYAELDPDIFGEELDKKPYAQVERIAAVGAVVEKAR